MRTCPALAKGMQHATARAAASLPGRSSHDDAHSNVARPPCMCNGMSAMHVQWHVGHACAMARRPSMCDGTSTMQVQLHVHHACAMTRPPCM
eukprot:7464-Chlamydomonas_euryale.AAC.1